MQWSDIPLKPPQRTLRQFAVLWMIFFGGLALFQWLAAENATAAIVLGALAMAWGPIGLIEPAWIRPIFIGSMIVAFPIGWLISKLLLAVLFYGLFTPLGVTFRLGGRDACLLRRPDNRPTYWTPKKMPTDPRAYFRQF